MSQTITTKLSVGLFIGIAAFVLFISIPNTSSAHGNDESRTNRTARTHTASTTSVDATCMQTAVDTRESSLSTAWDSFSTSVKSALATRKTSLHDAWGLSDVTARNTALKNAWKTWKDSAKVNHKKLMTDRKAAWEAFRKTTKDSCKVTAPKEEGQSSDAVGSV